MYVDVYLGLGELYASMAIVGYIAGLVLTPVAYKLVVFYGKRNSWFLSTLFTIGGMFYCGFLTPGGSSFISLIFVQVLFVLGSIFLNIVGPAMLNDVVDYGLLASEEDSRGVYFSLYFFLMKVEAALGVSLGLVIAGFLGFEATASQQTVEGGFAIRFAASWFPMVVTIVGLYFICRIPLDEARMAIVDRRLAKVRRGVA